MKLNQLPANALLLPIDGTAAAPSIQIGGGATGSSGTGVFGDESAIKFSVAGAQVASIDANGIVGTPANIKVFTSAATSGGAATEAVVVTGLLTTDTILSVTQKTKGANSLPLLGFSTVITNGLTVIYSADPGANAVVLVAVKR